MGKIGNIKHGALHRELGIPANKPIPTATLKADLAAAKRSGNVTLEKRIVFALNARNFNHK